MVIPKIRNSLGEN